MGRSSSTLAEVDNNYQSLKFMIMNTGGENVNVGEHPTEKRKQVIYDVVTNTDAALVLFQEFRWKGIRSRVVWRDCNWSRHFRYTGHKDASILYNINDVAVEECSQTLLKNTLDELIRIGDIHERFTPFPRMCLRTIKSKEVAIVEFICISWHGRHTGISLTKRKGEFKNMLIYISKLSEKLSLPVILAGDFNVEIEAIETIVRPPLVLYRYTPTERRRQHTIDFYICSESLTMTGINPLTLEHETDVTEVLSLFDHDPVVAFVSTNAE